MLTSPPPAAAALRSSPPARTRPRVKTWAVGLALLTGCVATYFATRPARSPVVTAAAAPRAGRDGAAAPALVVRGLKLTPRPVRETLALTGNVLAFESIALRPETTGKITAIHFAEGAAVHAGDALVQINDAELRSSLARARLRLKLAEDREQRLEILVRRSGVTQEDYDRSITEKLIAQTDIDVISAQLAKTTIVAPFDGVVGLRTDGVGSIVGTGDTIASLQVLDRVKLEFAVPERHRASIAPGLKVRFRVAGFADRHEAVVYGTEPAIDLATRTLRVRALAENPGGRLLPGAFAEVDVPLEEHAAGLMVPTAAIVAEGQRNTVFVAAGGKAQAREITTGMRFANEIFVRSGLNAGDVVITSGLLRLRPGAAVEVQLKD